MALKITSTVEHASGNVTTTYCHIAEYHKCKEGDKIKVNLRWYTSKARKDADITNESIPLAMAIGTIHLDMTMAEFAESENSAAAIYGLLKTYLEGLGHTVTDDI